MKPERLAEIKMMRRNWRYVMPHVVDELVAEVERLRLPLEDIASGLSVLNPYDLANETLKQ